MSLAEKLPPVSVRIKRKRTQDPLQGLVLDSSSIKKSRTDSFVFKLAGTFDESQDSSNDIVLNEDTAKPGDKRKRVFHISKPNKTLKTPKPPNASSPVEMNDTMALDDRKPGPDSRNDDVVPDQINQMVQSYLQGSGKGLGDEYTPDHDIEDYVYDIYYREPYNAKKWDKTSTNVGVIVLDSEDEHLFYQDTDSHSNAESDDEDSNAEDFYRNDYPDEDQEGEDYSRIGTAGDRKDTSDIREGLDYMGVDDDTLGLHDADEFDENWSEDENFEQYRDRIMGDLENKVSENKFNEL